MSRRKNKKMKELAKILTLLLVAFVYFYVISMLLFASYNYFNLREIGNYFAASAIIIALIPSGIISLLAAKNYKRWIEIIDMTKGLLVSLPIVVIMMFTTSYIYKTVRLNNIKAENERIFENYEKFIDFDEYEVGHTYRIDDEDVLYRMNGNKLESVSPITFYDLTNYEIRTYKIDDGYVIYNDMSTYYTKTLDEDALLYPVYVPILKIKRATEETIYFKLDKKTHPKVTDEYRSEQKEECLFLYKKFNKILYTQEKLYDLRIQVLNNFVASQEAVYEYRYVSVPINGKQYKVRFTFDEKLEVIYSKEEMQ